jgi:hypothetical protein
LLLFQRNSSKLTHEIVGVYLLEGKKKGMDAIPKKIPNNVRDSLVSSMDQLSLSSLEEVAKHLQAGILASGLTY